MIEQISKVLEEKYKQHYCYPEVSDGWVKIICDLYAELEPYFEHGLIIEQIKSKFGGLRVYFVFADYEGVDNDKNYKQVQAIISKYENIAKATCEYCGSIDNITTKAVRYWISTQCISCYEENKRKINV